MGLDPEYGALAAGTLHANGDAADVNTFRIGLRHEGAAPDVKLELQYRLAETLLKKREIAEAIELWTEIQRVRPDYKDVPAQLARYREINANAHTKAYLVGPMSEFVNLAKHLTTNHIRGLAGEDRRHH